METAERRSEILRILCHRRHETIENLASEFGVSERTIRRDVEILSLSKPIYTQSGRYGGGVYVMEGYSMDRMYMDVKELEVLKKLSWAVQANELILTDDEKRVLDSIISIYTKPETKSKTKCGSADIRKI